MRRSISSGQVALTAVTFAFLLAVALWEAQTRQNVLFHQVLNTVRVTMVLFGIAMCLFVLPGRSEGRETYWLLFWTASLVSFLAHIYVSFVVYFHASLHEFFATQGALVATVNVVTTVWWLFDVILSWFSTASAKWISIQRTGIHLLILFLFFLSTVVLHSVDNKETFVVILGVIQALSVLICFIIRIRAGSKTALQPNP